MRRPAPTGRGTVDHRGLAPVLDAVAGGGVAALAGLTEELAAYRALLHAVDPDSLTRSNALAFWINLYNAEALGTAAEALAAGQQSVLRLPGAFDRPRSIIAGERLSLDAIEHGKVRRFCDPRIHGALVCGSLSCPTLRFEPYSGDRLDAQLDDQLRSFLRSGGAVADRAAGELSLTRVLLWYGADFVRPHRMPALLPVRRRKLAGAISPWLDEDDATWIRRERPRVSFQDYDWALGCAVR